MSGPEWNFATYMACLGQNIAQGTTKPQHSFNRSSDTNANSNMMEEQKVFAELRPANRGNERLESDETVSKFRNINADVSGLTAITGHPEEPFTANVTCIDSSSLFDARMRSQEGLNYGAQEVEMQKGFEQQLMPWNLSILTELEEISINCNEAKSRQFRSVHEQDAMTNIGRNEGFMPQDFNNMLNRHDNYEIPGDDFKFPASIEEQYIKMVRGSATEIPRPLPRIETILSMAPQISGKENSNFNAIAEANITDFKTQTNVSPAIFGIQKRTGVVNPNDPRMYEAREVEADIYQHKAEPTCISNATKRVENIETILDMINPTKDIMGKTFHKIPSTQPIYSDNETRQNENDDENRIRRPMNAFMLWARKYRSLVAKEFSEASNSEISVKLGEIWNELSSEQQKPYFQKAESLKADHKQNYPNYVYQPRQARVKPLKRNRAMNRAVDKDEKEEGSLFSSIAPDFNSQVALKYTAKVSGIHNIGHVASTVVLSQDGTEVDLAQHVSKQPRIMAPKPVYPQGARPESRQKDEIKEDIGNKTVDFVWRTNETNRPLRLNKNYSEQEIYHDKEIGLLRDSMLPSLDRQGDECDLITEACPAFDVTDLEAYLAGVNSDFGDYMEKHSMEEEDKQSCAKTSRLKSAGKKKKMTSKSEHTLRKNAKKQRKTRERE